MKLHLPDKKPDQGKFSIHSSALQEWMESLPLIDLERSTRQIIDALDDFNSQDLKPAKRMRALEILDPTIHTVTESIDKLINNKALPLPLPLPELKMAYRGRAILNAFAGGYKILIRDIILASRRAEEKNLIRTAIHRALHYLGKLQLAAYETYDQYPDGTWSDIHQLYHYAEKHGMQNKKMALADHMHGTAPTIMHVYQQILLLALACPYRMRQGEAADVYRVLAEWSRQSRILTRPPANNRNGSFVIHLDSDTPPTYLVLRDCDEHTENCRFLDTTQLADNVRQALADLFDEDGNQTIHENGLRPEILNRLMLSWGVMPQRRFKRTPRQAKVILAIGTNAVHYFLGGKDLPDDNTMRGTTEDNVGGISVSHVNPVAEFDQAGFLDKAADNHRTQEAHALGQRADYWDPQKDEGLTVIEDRQLARPKARTSKTPNTRYQASTWKMVNVSAGGYCMLWDSHGASSARIGQLVGIQETADAVNHTWLLGVIRWLKTAKGQGLELGVELLSPGAIPIDISVCSEDGRVGDKLPGLMLPEISAIGQSAMLLLPPLPFHVGKSAILSRDGTSSRVLLDRLVENTGSFAQFHFVYADDIPEDEQT